jgi:hypothetical protein
MCSTRLRSTSRVDGKAVPYKRINTLNVGSIAIEIKNLIKLFAQADRDKKLHMHVGYLEPHEVFANLPNLFAGRDYIGKELVQTTSETIDIVSRETRGPQPVPRRRALSPAWPR